VPTTKIPVEPNRFLVVGLGSMGNRYASLATEMGLIPPEGLYLCDIDEQRSRRYACAYASTSLHEVLKRLANDGGLDVAVIATPATNHLVSLTTISNAFPTAAVLVEKPLVAGAFADEEALAPALFTRPIAVGYNWRFHPVVEKMRSFADQIVDVTMYVADDMRVWPGKYDGHPIAEYSHELDILRVLTRSPTVRYGRHTDKEFVFRGTHERGTWSVKIRPHHTPKGRWIRLRMEDGGRISYAWDTEHIPATYGAQLVDLFKGYALNGHPHSFRCSLADGVATALLIDDAYELIARRD